MELWETEGEHAGNPVSQSNQPKDQLLDLVRELLDAVETLRDYTSARYPWIDEACARARDVLRGGGEHD